MQANRNPQLLSAKIVNDLDTKRLGALPTATGGIARLAYARARRAGIELKPLLKKAGLTDQRIKDRGSRLPVQHQIQFLNLAANALHDEFLGFHLAQLCDLRELGLLFYVAASSETLGDALQRAARYSSITNEGLSLKCLEDEPDGSAWTPLRMAALRCRLQPRNQRLRRSGLSSLGKSTGVERRGP